MRTEGNWTAASPSSERTAIITGKDSKASKKLSWCLSFVVSNGHLPLHTASSNKAALGRPVFGGRCGCRSETNKQKRNEKHHRMSTLIRLLGKKQAIYSPQYRKLKFLQHITSLAKTVLHPYVGIPLAPVSQAVPIHRIF
jgi:hypothetical protein